MRLGSLAIAALALGACATTPSAPPAASAQGTAAAATAAAAPTAPTAQDTELTRWAKSQGYRPRMVRQTLVWCKRESTTGSRIATETCVSDVNMAAMRQTDEANKQYLLRQTVACPASSCGQGSPR